ncbi:MAG: hypothetical protein ACTSXQ_01520 [Alphaproteobacteria bacterium]
MMNKKNLFIFSLLLAAIFFSIVPNSEAKKEDSSAFQKWKNKEMKAFHNFKDKKDRAFTKMLQDGWEEVKILPAITQDIKPKPLTMEKAHPVRIRKISKPVIKAAPIHSVTIAPITHPKKTSRPHISKKKSDEKYTLDFYGNTLKIYADKNLEDRPDISEKLNEDKISSFWAALSRIKFDPIISQIQESKKKLKLNDWGYFLLAQSLAKEIYDDENEQKALTWFLLTKSGYKARIAYHEDLVYLLLPCKQPVYETAYITFNNTPYYLFNFENNSDSEKMIKRLYSYKGTYPEANKVIDLRLYDTIKTGNRIREKTLSFHHDGDRYKVNINNDLHLVDFYSTYPPTDIAITFKAPVNSATRNSLILQLKRLIMGRSEKESVNLLLHFVQTAFPYKTDEEQFGKENALFVEETIYYPASDAEDRAILFAWLVRNLLKLDVIGIDYPGHTATAIRFKGRIPGNFIKIKGKRYVIADPTYIMANVGMPIPSLRKTKPQPIF